MMQARVQKFIAQMQQRTPVPMAPLPSSEQIQIANLTNELAIIKKQRDTITSEIELMARRYQRMLLVHHEKEAKTDARMAEMEAMARFPAAFGLVPASSTSNTKEDSDPYRTLFAKCVRASHAMASENVAKNMHLKSMYTSVCAKYALLERDMENLQTEHKLVLDRHTREWQQVLQSEIDKRVALHAWVKERGYHLVQETTSSSYPREPSGPSTKCVAGDVLSIIDADQS
jgi:hypothetical protein